MDVNPVNFLFSTDGHAVELSDRTYTHTGNYRFVWQNMNAGFATKITPDKPFWLGSKHFPAR